MPARLPTLWRAGLYWFFRHPWQLVLAVVGIVAGVSVMAAVDIATDSARRAFLLSMDAIHGEATHQIVAGPRGVDEALYVDLRTRRAFRNVAPIVDGYVEAGDTTLRLLGVDVFAEREFRRWTLPGAGADGLLGGDHASDREIVGRLLTRAGTVLMSQRTAERLGVAVGDRFEVRADGRERAAVVAGIVGDDATAGLDEILVADIATAQEWLSRIGRLTRIDVRIAPTDDQSLERLRGILPPDVRVLDAEGRTQSVREMSDAFMTNLMAMSLLALLVGIFLIYNSVSFAVLQRRGLLGVLRALGVTSREAFLLVMFEALVLGAAGSLLGLAVGIWLGERLLGLVSRSINDLYFVVSVTEISVTLPTLATAFAAGCGATLLAAALPALEAAASRPQLALMRSSVERRTRRAVPIVALAGLILAILAVALLAVSGHNLPAGLAAVFMLLLGCALAIPLLVRIVATLAAPVAAAFGGIAARHAIAGIGASLSRTGVAVVALAVAVSATIGVTVMVDSFRTAVVDWVERSLRADLYVGVGDGSLEPTLARDLQKVDGIAAYSSTRRVWLDAPGIFTRLTVLDLPPEAYAGTRLLQGEPDDVWPAFEADGGVLVSASYAYRHDVGPGESVMLPTRHGSRAFPVVATFQSYDADLDAVLMSRHTYDVFWDDPAIDSLGLYLEDDADPATVIAHLRQVSAGRQTLLVRSNAELRERTMAVFNRTFVITDVLYWLALGVEELAPCAVAPLLEGFDAPLGLHLVGEHNFCF
jgi:putative ABC transport system permease protein